MARVRTAFLFLNSPAVSWILLSCLLIKVGIFMVEVTEKRHLLKPSWKHVGPEEVAGIVNRAFFIWLNKIFIKGFRTLLTVDKLSTLDAEMLGASRSTKLRATWAKGMTFERHLTKLSPQTSHIDSPDSKSRKRAFSISNSFLALQMGFSCRYFAEASLYRLQLFTAISRPEGPRLCRRGPGA